MNELVFDLSDTSIDVDINDDKLTFDLITPSDVTTEIYTGAYEVTPKTYSQTLATQNKKMYNDVRVLEIPYYETSNDKDGKTVYIANTLA